MPALLNRCCQEAAASSLAWRGGGKQGLLYQSTRLGIAHEKTYASALVNNPTFKNVQYDKKLKIQAWQYSMQGHAEQCVDRYLELTGKDIGSLKTVSTPRIDDHLLSPEDFEEKGEVAEVASRIVLKALYLARTNRPDVLWPERSRNGTKHVTKDSCE